MVATSISIRLEPALTRECQMLAHRLGVPLLQPGERPRTDYLIEVSSESLGLSRAGCPGEFPLRVTFAGGRKLIRSDPLRKAIGAAPRTVVDATAGWGADALALAMLGHKVTAVERHPVVAAMLDYAKRQVSLADLSNLHVVHADSIDYLAKLPNSPDVVYIDPMFPPRSKSAAVKKPMATLQDLVGPGNDLDQLFRAAVTRARQRVVVKRPIHARPIAPGRSGEIRGKSVRFDLYPAEGGA